MVVMKNKKSGFTLIELLVVMAIMGILTIITVSQFTLARKRAADSQRKTDLSSVSKALEMYYADYGQYPGPTDLDGDKDLNLLWGLEMKDKTGYIYMKVVPKENNPLMTPYCYKYSADKKKFGLYTTLENTNDSECLKDEEGDFLYSGCDEQEKIYCFAVSSVNADPTDPLLKAIHE